MVGEIELKLNTNHNCTDFSATLLNDKKWMGVSVEIGTFGGLL